MTKFWLGQMPKNQLRLLAKIQLELQNKNANESETKHERDGMNASVQIGYGRAFSFLLREISCLVKVVMAMTHDILSSAVGTKHLSGYGEHGGGGDLGIVGWRVEFDEEYEKYEKCTSRPSCLLWSFESK